MSKIKKVIDQARPSPEEFAKALEITMSTPEKLDEIVAELRKRMAGPPHKSPVYGAELIEWANRLEAASQEIKDAQRAAAQLHRA